MGFVQKLKQFERAANAMFPAREREPTIAEDYPLKWAEIQRRRRIGVWFCLLIGIAFLFLVALRLQELLPIPFFDAAEQVRLRPYAYPIFIIGFLGIVWSGELRCPRCKKQFKAFSPRVSLSGESRCQHCNLQLGEPHNEKPVR